MIATINQDLNSTISGVTTLTNKIGIFGSSIKDISDTINSGQGIKGLKNLFANTNTGFITQKDLTQLQAFRRELILTGDKGLALSKTMVGASKGARELAMSVDTSAEGMKAFKTKLDNVEVAEQGYIATTIGAKVATIALQTAITFGITLAIQALISMFQKLKTSIEDSIPNVKNTSKWLEESSEEVNNIKNNLSGLNDKLTTTKERLEELQKKGHLSVVEQKELTELTSYNDELERQIQLEKTRLQIAQGKNEANVKKAIDAIKNQNKDENEDKEWWEEGLENLDIVGLHNIKASDNKYGFEYVGRLELEDGDSTNAGAFRNFINKYLDLYYDTTWGKNEDKFKEADEWISNYLKSLRDVLDQLGEYDYDSLSTDMKNYVDEIVDLENTYLMLKEKATPNGGRLLAEDNENLVFKSILNQSRFAQGKEAIESLKESQSLSAESLQNLYNSDANVKAMVDNMQAIGLINDTNAESFKRLIPLIDGFNETISKVYNSEKHSNARTAIQSLIDSGKFDRKSLVDLYNTNKEVKALFDEIYSYGYGNLEGYGEDAAAAGDNLVVMLNQVFSSIEEGSKTTEETNKQLGMFDDLMNEKGTDKNPSFVEGIEKSVEQLQKLEDALVKFESGTLTDKEKTSLFKAFPQLTAYADNLGAGIRNLLGEMRGDVISQFTEKIDEFKKAGATEEEIAQLEAYERTILNIADSVDSVKNALDSMKSVFKDLDSVIKDYNENQYFSLESLEKLGQNGQRYLSYLSYENGQLKINEEAYKKLVLAQIDEIETKATLQATTDLQSLTDETTAKEYLAKVNIDLAQSQLTAAQAAFQYQLALKLAQGGSVAKAAQKVADNLNSLRNIFASARSQVDDYAAAMLGATSATEKKAKASEKAKSALESEQRALEHSKKALEDEKKALEDTKSEHEKAQKAIEDLIKWTQNYIKQIKEDEVKALQDKKEKFDELIEKQKESLQAEKDLHDYEKSVGEKQDTLASNALKVSATSLDDSGAGKKAYKKAQEEYKKSQTDMEDFLYDHSIETREKALDQLKEDTDKSYDEQIKTIQDYLSNEVQLYRDACKMIDNDNGTLYGKLLNYCLTYTTTGKKEFDHMWSLAQTAMEKYNVASVGTMQFMDELKGRIYDVDDAIDAVSKNIETYESRISDVKTQLDNLKDAAVEAKNAIDAANSTPLKGDASKSPNNSDNGMRYIGRGYDAASGKYYYKVSYRGRDYWSYVGDSSDTDRVRNLAALGISKEIAKYHSGFDTYGLSQVQHALGVNVKNIGHYASGTRSAKSGIAQINENGLETLMRKTPDGDFVIMNQDDQVYTKKQTDNLYDFASDPEKFLSEKGLSPLSQEELANLGLWGDSSQLGMINSAFGVGGLSGLIEKITGGSGITSSSATTNNIAPVVNITIQGDATQSTVNALHAEAENIVQRARSAAHNDFIETVLKGRKWR